MPRFIRGGRGAWRKIQGSHGKGYSPNTSGLLALIFIIFVLVIAHYVVYSFASPTGIMVAVVFLGLTIKCAINKKWKKSSRLILSCICTLLCVSFLLAGIFGLLNQQNEREAMCSIGNCEYRHLKDSQFCYNHTCHLEGCNNYKDKADSYCYIHATEQIPNIVISNEELKETIWYGDVYYSFSADIKAKNEKKLFCYAVLTLFDEEGKKVYKVCDLITDNITGWESASFRLKKSSIPRFETYSWEVVREKPYGLEWDGIYYS